MGLGEKERYSTIYVAGYRNNYSGDYTYATIRRKPLKSVKLKLVHAGILAHSDEKVSKLDCEISNEIKYFYIEVDCNTWKRELNYKYHKRFSSTMETMEMVEVTPDEKYGNFVKYYIPVNETDEIRKQIYEYASLIEDEALATEYVTETIDQLESADIM